LAAALISAGLLCLALFPSAAAAHTGASNPVASSYLAKLTGVPAGIEARVVGGDLRMWIRVSSPQTVIVQDYRGAPYLRFSPSGVDVNTNSSMYYLNQPTPLRPPARLTRTTSPNWVRAGFGDAYAWHDGRLHALASVALAPGQTQAGTWRIPLIVNGTHTAISGILEHANDPSIVWFWPILVLLLCLWAGSRLGRRRLDAATASVLALSALAGIVVLAVGHELQGEPFVSPGQEIILSLVLAFAAALTVQVLWKGPGPVSLILTLVAALWGGVQFLPTLLHGFVLMAVPTFLARLATVTCLSCGIGLIVLLFAFRLADTPEQYDEMSEAERNRRASEEDFERWESFA
jgi:hypothetical protein